MAASAVFSYDANGSTISAQVSGGTVGDEYFLYAEDPTSQNDILIAPASSFTLQITNVGGFVTPVPFAANVYNNTTCEWVAATNFVQGITSQYQFGITWTYDGVSNVTATFVAAPATTYDLYAWDNCSSSAAASVVGTGALVSLSLDYTPDVFVGRWVATLYESAPTFGTFATRLFDQGVVSSGSPGNPPLLSPSELCERTWRFLVTDLAGESITLLDHLASERTVTPLLNEPLQVTGTVPSDNPEVNLLHTDNFPFLAEGVRQLYCFRRESNAVPYYTIRASTLIMQMDDAARSDDARSRFTAWDPWQYLFSRPVLQSTAATVVDPAGNSTPGVDGVLIPAQQLLYPSTMTVDQIVLDIFRVTVAFADPTAPVAAQACFIDTTSGTLETCATIVDGFPVQQGTSVGQALKDLCDTGNLDIVLSPIYDPSRPGILCELNIFSQTVSNGEITKLGAGSYNYSAQFAWDRPGRSLVGFDNLFEGTGRANYIQYYNGQGGPPVTAYLSPASIVTYGEYWAQQFFPAQTQAVAVEAIAKMQLVFRRTVKETLTVNPVPEQSPEPFTDYDLGDGVPVFIGKPQQGSYAAGVSRSRQSLPPGYRGAPPSPNPVTLVWQRIYGIPVEIDDNGVETVRELIVGPVGAPPAPAGAGGQQAPQINQQVPITTARSTNRQGGVSP